jgi:hypothetical protein
VPAAVVDRELVDAEIGAADRLAAGGAVEANRRAERQRSVIIEVQATGVQLAEHDHRFAAAGDDRHSDRPPELGGPRQRVVECKGE